MKIKNLHFVILLITISLIACNNDESEDIGPLEISYTMESGVGLAIPANPNNSSIPINTNVRYFLNQTVDNYYDASEIRIDSIHYSFSAIFNNTYAGARIQNTLLEINNITLGNVPDINILDESANQTIFKVDNPEALEELEAIFMTESTINAYFRGNILTDKQSVIFGINLDIYFTVTF